MRYCTIRAVVAVAWLVGALPQPSDSAALQTWWFNIPRQRAAGGIAAFSHQAVTVQLLVAQDDVRGRRTNRLHGGYSVEAGLTELLRASGLRWRRTGPTTYSLTSADRKVR